MKGRPNPAPDEGGKDSKGLVRWIVGAVLTVAVAGYMAGIVAGRIAEAQRLGLADLAVIVIAALLVCVVLWPEQLQRVRLVKLGQVELQLRVLRRDQENQKDVLDSLRYALQMLVTGAERAHLENLAKGLTADYHGNEPLRWQLRQLRDRGLIQSKRYISEIGNGGSYNLADFVELTPEGKDYLFRTRDELEPISLPKDGEPAHAKAPHSSM